MQKKALLLATLISASLFAQDAPRYFGQSTDTPSLTIPYGQNSETGHYAELDDVKLYYEVYGQGEPLIVLHGGLVGSITEMGVLIEPLAKQYQVIAVNTRGHGKSSTGTKLPSYEQKATDLANLLAELKIEKATIVGFSDGAYTAFTFAKDHPEKVAKLVAIGAGDWPKGWRDFAMPFEQLEALDPSYWQQQASIRPDNAQFKAWYERQTQYYNSAELSQTLFEQVKVPTLLIAGEDDQNVPLDSIIRAYKWLPNADLAIIANTPHPTFLANFPAVWAAIEPFLNQKP